MRKIILIALISFSFSKMKKTKNQNLQFSETKDKINNFQKEDNLLSVK